MPKELTSEQMEDLIARAMKRSMLSNTVARGDHSADIAKIAANVEHIKETMDEGKQHFSKLDDCMVELTKKSSEQGTEISLLKQTQSNCKESKKTLLALTLGSLAIVWGIISSIFKLGE